MDSRFKSFALIALIVACLGYFYSKDTNSSSDDLTAPSYKKRNPAQEALPRKQVAPTHDTSNEKPQDTETDTQASIPTEAPAVSEAERSRIQSEIKSTLASLYVAQKAFHAEFGRYTTDLKAIAWDPSVGQMVNVKAGFVEPAMGLNDLIDDESLDTRLDTDYFMTLNTDPLTGEKVSFQYTKFSDGVSLRDLSQHCRRGCTATSDRFEIMAAAKIGPNGEVDVWTIDDDKNLVHITE